MPQPRPVVRSVRPPVDIPAHFEPLRRSTGARRRLVMLGGPLLWLVALLVLAVVVKHRDAVELALLILGASFAAGLVLSGCMRRARVREERGA